MMEKEYPVYSIGEFQRQDPSGDFYANYLNPHVKSHHFTNLPHKHDFYLTMLITGGSGRHEIDFVGYDATPGTLFFMKPGQMHYWELSDDIEGFVFFHSKAFYEEQSAVANLKDFAFYASGQSVPTVTLDPANLSTLRHLMEDLVLENKEHNTMKWPKVHATISLIYIAVARSYAPKFTPESAVYMQKIQAFEDLIEEHYKKTRFARDYARQLHITEKHLNRITKNCFNKTSSALIAERVLLEAKRMLMYSNNNVTEIADVLGFNEPSYFIRFFKKHTGTTPMVFVKEYLMRR